MHRGGCKCGVVAYEADGEIDKVMACNCSICRPKGYLHWFVKNDRFRLLKGGERLASFQFGKKVMNHRFCPDCGVATHVEGPGMVGVNARTVEGVDLDALKVEPYDGASK